MTEPVNDNDPVSGVSSNFSYSVEVQDSYEFLSTQRNKNDIFVCRKCNKIFTDLSQYVEHKVKEENFSIGKTRSKSDHRVILPRLVQKRNRKASQLESKSKKLKIDNEKPSDESDSQHISAPEAKDCTSVSSGNTLFKSISNMYACKQCNKTFRREAALQRHLKYDHKNEDLEEELDASESELYRDDSDEEYSLEPKEKPGNDGTKETEEILIVIGNPHTSAIKPAEKDSRNENELEKVEEAASDFSDKGSKSDIKTRRSRGEVIKDVQKYTCNVCGRGFNEQSVFKAHALVHSEQRKYVCTVKSCPYAFKTKGGLVRHMRRHTGDRPYNCDRCGRSFSESGSLTRHLKARRNCAALPDKAYPRYMKSWTYHPNIPAVVDPALRDPERGRSTLGPVTIPATGSFTEEDGEEVHYIITELFDDASALSAATVITVDALDVPTSISPTVALDGCYSVTMENSGDVNLLEKSNETVTDDENKSANVSKDNRTPENTAPEENLSSPSKELQGSVGKTQEDSSLDATKHKNEERMGTALSLANLSQSPEAQSKASTTLVQSQGETTSLSPCQAASSHVVSKTMTICQSQPSIHPSSGAESVRNSNLQPQKTLNIQSIELDKDFQDLRANVEVESLKLTQCHVCKKDFEALEGLEIHLRTHLANEPSRCGLCHFTAQDREELRQHILGMHHQSLNDIEASVLAMEVEEQSLRKGETVQSRQLTLRNALTAVKQLYSLKKHKHPSQQDKPGLSTTGSVQCMVCNKFFRGSSYLRQHMRTHTGDRPHQCQHCGRSFTSRDILKKHMYVHQERKDYKCGECGKLFKRLGHVQQHLRTHSQERAFRCSMCDKLFKTQHSLKVHLRTHSGINPYKCPVCNNHFRERGSLQRHMRLHTGEKPFKCHLCNRAFSEQGTLSRHLKAKVPCSASRDQTNVPSQASVDQNVRAEDFSNVLPQLTPVVPSNQQILLNTNQVTTVQQEMSQGIGQQQFFVQTGQVQEVGSEYVILQSGDEATADQESVVIAPEVNLDGSMIELNTTFEQNQISAVEANMPGTETLHVVDPSTGEAVIIVAEKAIVDLVREQHSTLQATEGGCSLDKIKEIVIGARDSIATSGSSPTQEKTDVNFEGDDKSNVQEEKVLHEEQIDPTKE